MGLTVLYRLQLNRVPKGTLAGQLLRFSDEKTQGNPAAYLSKIVVTVFFEKCPTRTLKLRLARTKIQFWLATKPNLAAPKKRDSIF